MLQNLWDALKPVLKRKVIVPNALTEKQACLKSMKFHT